MDSDRSLLESIENLVQAQHNRITDEANAKNEMGEKLATLKIIWGRYKEYLQEKYPMDEGVTWEFACEHHKAIDKILGTTG